LAKNIADIKSVHAKSGWKARIEEGPGDDATRPPAQKMFLGRMWMSLGSAFEENDSADQYRRLHESVNEF